MKLEQSILIHRPVDEVLAYVTDPDKLSTWQPTTVEVRRQTTGPLRVGEQFSEVHAAMGRKLESTFEVAEHDRPRAFALRALDGPIALHGRWTFAAADDGATALRFVGEGEITGPLRLVRGLLARTLDRRLRSYHAQLKGLLEREPARA